MPDSRFPFRMRRVTASDYLGKVHDIPVEPKTLANRNAKGLSPKPRYLGTIPYYDQPTLDEYAAEAFTEESPVKVLRRDRARQIQSELEDSHT